jgi:outer membrane protein TolC
MGLDLVTPLVIADDQLEYQRVGVELPVILEQALARRPEMVKANLGVKNATLQEKLAAAQFHANVGLFGCLSTITGSRTFPNPNETAFWAAGVSAEVPLFEGGRRLAERRRARQLELQAREALELVRSYITLEVQQVHLEYQEMTERLSLDEAAVRDGKGALKSYHDQFVGNLIADKDLPKYFENLVTARLLLSTSQARYNQHVYAYNLALAKVRLVTGADE